MTGAGCQWLEVVQVWSRDIGSTLQEKAEGLDHS